MTTIYDVTRSQIVPVTGYTITNVIKYFREYTTKYKPNRVTVTQYTKSNALFYRITALYTLYISITHSKNSLSPPSSLIFVS